MVRVVQAGAGEHSMSKRQDGLLAWKQWAAKRYGKRESAQRLRSMDADASFGNLATGPVPMSGEEDVRRVRGPSNKKMPKLRPGTAETYLYLDEAGHTVDKRIMGDNWQQLRCQMGCRRELENSGLMFFLAC
jgi:hypothetical protein